MISCSSRYYWGSISKHKPNSKFVYESEDRFGKNESSLPQNEAVWQNISQKAGGTILGIRHILNTCKQINNKIFTVVIYRECIMILTVATLSCLF